MSLTQVSCSEQENAGDLDTKVFQDPGGETHFHSLNKPAVISLGFGLLSLLALFIPPMVFFSLVAIACALIGFSSLRRFPDEFVGVKSAWSGLLLGIFSLIGCIAYQSYIYATEVPEGYQRISFRTLKDDPRTQRPWSEDAEELDGKKVFVRCYTRPGAQRENLTKFIAVGNFGDCCFGGTEKLTDVIGVRILTGETVDYSLRLRRVGGVFRLNRAAALTGDSEVPQVYYQIEADYIR